MVTILIAPLMTCSARLPVYALLIGAFIPARAVAGGMQLQGLVLLGLYLAGVLGAMAVAWLLKRFNGNLTLAAAGYNAGEGAVAKYNGVPPYSETQRYVQRVAMLAERYRGTVAAR